MTSGLVACDIDGTLLRTGHPVSSAVREAAAAVRGAGNHLVLATGRSLAGALPVAEQLGLRDTWVVASNGAVTARLTRGGFEVIERHDLDAETAVRAAVATAPGIRISAEIVGVGYRVNIPFPDEKLNGTQHSILELQDLWARPTPRLSLHGSAVFRVVPTLRALGLTAIATRGDWVDATAPGISKATALEKVRSELGVEDYNTVAIGDDENDLGMLMWAARSFAMGHAPALVVAAADHLAGTVDQDGAAAALHSLLS
ncbi:HAD family hydrolase [Promicromonospora sp. NPDC052451]|uniref:HAD family hydrolase n=1 Tax=Promicromonospora sp. NPDC052451 TaxID=3364407 RepID=UPI0037CAFA5A